MLPVNYPPLVAALDLWLRIRIPQAPMLISATWAIFSDLLRAESATDLSALITRLERLALSARLLDQMQLHPSEIIAAHATTCEEVIVLLRDGLAKLEQPAPAETAAKIAEASEKRPAAPEVAAQPAGEGDATQPAVSHEKPKPHESGRTADASPPASESPVQQSDKPEQDPRVKTGQPAADSPAPQGPAGSARRGPGARSGG